MSKSKKIGCGCNYCTSNGIRKDFRHDHGSGPEEIPYRKPAKTSNKFCKRAKEPKTPHDFTKKIYVWKQEYDFTTKTYTRIEQAEYICARCGKPARWFGLSTFW